MPKYDYENRITKVLKAGPITVAEFAYDALGRRIKKTDSIAGQSTVYYYNDKWQVLCEYGGRNWATMLQWFAYGNYIDETLLKGKQNDETPESLYLHLYVQDHLYSTVALVQRNGVSVLERYEYDAYGNCQILSPTYQPRATSSYSNPYFFTGRTLDTLDTLDNGNLKLQDNRNRYYDYYTGRWLTHDPLGIVVLIEEDDFFLNPREQYLGGCDLYEYGSSKPTQHVDPYGLLVDELGCEYIKGLYKDIVEPGITEAERIKRIRKLYRAFGKWGGVRYEFAPAVMRHWLSGSDRDFRIPKELVLSVPQGKEARKFLIGQIKDNIWCTEMGMTPGFKEKVETPSGTDLYYTTGTFTLKAYALYWKSWLCRSCNRKVEAKFWMRDPYDWHTGLGVTICGLHIPDSWAYDLGVADGLKTFDVWAEWTEDLGCQKCKCSALSSSPSAESAASKERW